MVTTDHVTETSPHKFATEASCLQLRPGTFPDRLATTLGNGRPLMRYSLSSERAIYLQANGCVVVTVFND